MKRVKRISILILLFLCFVLPLAFFRIAGGEAVAHADSDDAYMFTNIHLDAEVRKDKTVSITETLNVMWRKSQNSLIRDIQKISRTTRIINGKEKAGKRYFAGISDVAVTLDGEECNWSFIPESDDFYLTDFFSIEMQKPSGRFQSGEENTFQLSYIYDMSDDKAHGFDDFTFDILGYAMAYTDEFSAEITFPETVEQSNFSLRTIRKYSNKKIEWVPDTESGEQFEISGNTVSITAFPASSGKGYTIQYILPDGYFVTGGVTFYWLYIVFAGIALVAFIAGLSVFFVNLPKKPVEVVEFYPPEDISLMRFAAICHRGASMKDCAALILKWAGEGIITVEKDGESDVILRPVIQPSNKSKKKDNKKSQREESEVTIMATADNADSLTAELPEEKNIFPAADAEQISSARKAKKNLSKQETIFYNTLFSGIGGNNMFSTRLFTFKASRSDKEKFYHAANGLVTEGNKPETVNVKKCRKSKALMAVLSLVPLLSIMLYIAILFDGWLALFAFVFMAAATGVSLMRSLASDKFNLLQYIFFTAFSAIFFFLPYSVLFLGMFANTVYDYLNLAFILPVWWVINNYILLLPFFMGKRSEEAQKYYGNIRGFKRFLLTAELPRIQLLFDENPEYFTDIIPYCLIMGISNKVKKRFAALRIELPAYYGGVNERNIMRSVGRAVSISAFSYAASRAGSGGGSSGGGGRGGSFGGGGGGGGSRSR